MAQIDKVIALVEGLEGKNQYTQSGKRERVFDGYSDCSSLMWKCFERGANKFIGTWTGEQVQYGKLVTNQFNGRHALNHEDLKKMKPGDLVFWGSGHNNTKHVEMYMGGDTLMGHGSGIGPRRKVATAYSHTYPLVEVRRYIIEDSSTKKPSSFVTTDKATCTGNGVNVRASASLLGTIIGTLDLGDVMELDGNKKGKWCHVYIKGLGVGWIHGDYVAVQDNKPAPEDSKYRRKFVGRCTGNGVAIRTWAGTEYDKIKSYGALYKGNLVDVLTYDQKDSKGNKWYFIRVAGKYHGFVRSDYIVKN